MKLRSKERPWPASKIEHWSVLDLKPSAFNARQHTEDDVDAVTASMERWGVTTPILVDDEGNIIAGHCRVLAAAKLGYATIPIVVARGWTEAEKRAYCIADNQLAARATWNHDILAAELKYLQAEAFDLELIGFDQAGLLELLQPLDGSFVGDPEATPELTQNPVTCLGDTWLLGRHRVHCGDSTQATAVATALADLTPQIMATDPPYGVDYDASWRTRLSANQGNHATGKVLNDHRADWRGAWALFPGDVAYVWHAGLSGGVVGESLMVCGFQLRTQIVWVKPHFVLSRGDYHWQHEACFYAVRGGAKSHWAGDRKQSTVWEIANNSAISCGEREQTWGHSTQKPVECMRRPIENNSKIGDVVYDPFLGSGTTLIAAEMTGRICVGLELSPAFVDVIVQRWQAFTGKTALLEGTGQIFTEVEATRRAQDTGPGRRKRVHSWDGEIDVTCST